MKIGKLETDEGTRLMSQLEIESHRIAMKQEKWDLRFLAVAKEVATWSKDPSTKVGAIIVDFDRRIVSTGYNGFPRGFADDPELYANRDAKLDRVIHAEMNAIIQAARDVKGYTMYCSAMPCHKCALGIIQAGIHRVVGPKPSTDLLSRWADSFKLMHLFFADAGVNVVEYE